MGYSAAPQIGRKRSTNSISLRLLLEADGRGARWRNWMRNR